MHDLSLRNLLIAIEKYVNKRTENLYILSWVPEQGEDIYDVLVDGVIIVRAEIPRAGIAGREAYSTSTVKEYISYRINMSKRDRRQLEIALALAEEMKR